ncbi:MAG: site-2 protease family protein [Eubacteriaceae bacterium]|nr:site-2 protease family protein [Eubacteriaceae bacterium]
MIISALLSVSIHECAHGYTALAFGDPTAKIEGRLTLNPLKHIDILGLIMLILLKIGYAKPVPINPFFFEDRKKAMFAVSAAGPLSNLIIAVVSGRLALLFASLSWNSYVVLFFVLLCQLNVGYAVFNLLPFPPLDGSKMFASLLPAKWEMWFYKYQKYLYVLVLIMYFAGVLDKIINPVIRVIYSVIIS